MVLCLALNSFLTGRSWGMLSWRLKRDPLQVSGILSIPMESWGSLVSRVHLLNPGGALGSAWIPSLIKHCDWKLFKLRHWQDWLHLFLLSQGSLFFVAWCPMLWRPLFHIFYHYFSCFGWKGKSGPCYCILARSRGSLVCSLSIWFQIV